MTKKTRPGGNHRLSFIVFSSILFLSGTLLIGADDQNAEETGISGVDFQLTITSLEKQISESTDTAEKRKILIQAARLYELAGDIEAAQKYYEQSVLVEINEDSFPYLYSSALVLFEMGEWEKSLFQCELIINGSADQDLRAKALNLTIRSLIELDRVPEGTERFNSLRILSDSPPRELYSFYVTALRLGLTDSAEQLKNALTEKYPASMEARLLSGKIAEYPSPYRFFYELPGSGDSADHAEPSDTLSNADSPPPVSQNVFIQIGSFRDKENAEYRRVDAETAGLKAEIREVVVNGTQYYRLVVPSSAQTLQQDLAMLKSKGFEGYPLYE